MTDKLVILRTGAGSPASCPVIDELIREGCEVIVADADPLSFGLYHYPESEVIPLASSDEFVPHVIDICNKRGVHVIIPTVDEELLVFAKEKKRFEDEGIRVVVSEYETITSFDSKLETYTAFIRIGVGTPLTFLDAGAFPEGDRIVVKPNRGRGSTGVRVANDRRDAELYAQSFSGEVPVMQEYLEGREFTVDALCDFDGKILCGAVRESITKERGISIKSRIVDEPKIWRDVEKMTFAMSFCGPFNVQCIMFESGERKFFDLNPRYAGSVALSIKAGVPIVRDLVRMLRGEEVVPSGCVTKELYMLRYWQEKYLDPEDMFSVE